MKVVNEIDILPPVLSRKPGRPKGVNNRNNIVMKEMIEDALTELGGTQWLVDTARQYPIAFLGMITKLIPSTVNAHVTKLSIIEQYANRSLDDHNE